MDFLGNCVNILDNPDAWRFFTDATEMSQIVDRARETPLAEFLAAAHLPDGVSVTPLLTAHIDEETGLRFLYDGRTDLHHFFAP